MAEASQSQSSPSMIMKPITLLSFSIAIPLLATTLQAASFTWNGGGGNASFTTPENWVDGVAPTSGATHDYTFAGTLNTTPTLSNATWQVRNITFASGAASFDIKGTDPVSTSSYRFQFTSLETTTISQNSLNNQTISATIYLANNNTSTVIQGSGAGSLTLGSLRFGAAGANTNSFDIQRDVTIGQITRTSSGNGALSLSVASGTTTRISGTIGGNTVDDATSFSLQKSGNGTLILSGTNRNTGTTQVSAGTLLINSDQSLATGTMTVNSGATIGGTGTIGGAALVNGNLSAGQDGAGLLTFAGGLTLSSSSNSIFEIDGLGRGIGFDAVDVTGALVYGGVLTLDFGFAATVGQQFDLFNFTTQSGAFTSLNFLNAGYNGNFDYGSGVLTLTAVPEPGTAAMLLAGGSLMIALRRRRK